MDQARVNRILERLNKEFWTIEERMVEYTFHDRYKRCDSLVRLYARMGLHRYNLRQGTNLKLSHVEKYKETTHSAACSFFITMVAVDPAMDSPLTFQTLVCERDFNKFTLACSIARPQVKSTEEDELEIPYYPEYSLPKCPTEDPFKNENLFYLLKKSERQQHKDWIRLYLELAVGAAHTNMGRDLDLSKLKIVKVAIQAIDDDVEQPQQPNEGWLNAMNAIVYIRYKDCCEARVGRNVNRIAIVRRTFNESYGFECFMLDGVNKSSKILRKKETGEEPSRSLNVHESS